VMTTQTASKMSYIERDLNPSDRVRFATPEAARMAA
jgi:hypothetical protein